MKHRLGFFLGFLLLATSLGAQTVDRDEFSDILTKTINFENYTGTYQHLDTLEQITAIGRGLATGLVRDRSGRVSFGAKYSVIHALGTPEEKGKPADIILLLPNSGVDHIDNVRRIVSAYLGSMYGYTKPDADILAVFITIYNAVYRGNLVLFESRYKASVLKYLSADKVGLSLKYTDWPGKTQLVIPLSLVATEKNGSSLSSVSTASLVTPQVIETVRDKPDSGTTERQKLSDLMDRSVDQEQNAIDQKKAQLAADLAANQKRQQEIDAQLAAKAAADKAAAKTSPGTTPAPAKTVVTPDEKALTAEKQKLVTQEKQIQTEAKQLDTRQTENKDTAAASKDLRSSTAEDLQKQGNVTAESAVPVIVLKSRLENGLILSQAQRVVLSTAEVLQQSSLRSLIGRHFISLGDNLLALSQDGNSARLVLLSTKDLELAKKGGTVISPYSELVAISGNTEFLAVMQDSGEWYLGVFDLQLNPVNSRRSEIAVDPVGAITINGDKVQVQRKDGRFTSLDLKDLRLSK